MDLKNAYSKYHDEVWRKRFDSVFPLRRFVHQEEYELAVKMVAGKRVLDVGTGEGVVPFLAKKPGRKIVAVDISRANIKAAKARQEKGNWRPKTEFLLADAENLPFADNSFDTVICLHVLEHLPNFQKGLRELRRVAKGRMIIAVPTCLSPCAISLLGGDRFWELTVYSPLLFCRGLWRVVAALGRDGVEEGYGESGELPHLWRFPWVFLRELDRAGLKVTKLYASSFCFPYLNFLIPLWKQANRLRGIPGFNYFGYGSMAIIDKDEKQF